MTLPPHEEYSMQPLNIAMVCDFFHPNVGGVESHIYMLSAKLLSRGHKVIVITHAYPPSRVGVRWLLPGLKVYYLPFRTLVSSATLPNFLCQLPYLRTIVIRENIQLIHAHAALSSMAHEGILHSHLLGVRTVFTDHSLFGFDDAASILTNKLLEGALRNVDAVICVSHTGRENTVLRGKVKPETSYAIPSALVADQFVPAPERAQSLDDSLTIVVLSRLVYRKGIDLLVVVVPRICELFPKVRFVIGGSGPKMIDILQMREKHALQDRIELIGAVKPADVRDVLTRGHIYLNTSLTEAFGIAILEAACAGLYVVSTKVGGVPEALPPGDGEHEGMIMFASPEEDDLIRAVKHAIQHVTSGLHDPIEAHNRIRGFYDWESVVVRTEKVYDDVMRTEARGFWTRVHRNMSMGRFFGPIFTIIFLVDCLFFTVIEWLLPAHDIERVECEWTRDNFKEAVETYTDQQSNNEA